jgi:hypothetical protein
MKSCWIFAVHEHTWNRHGNMIAGILQTLCQPSTTNLPQTVIIFGQPCIATYLNIVIERLCIVFNKISNNTQFIPGTGCGVKSQENIYSATVEADMTVTKNYA